MKLKLRVQKLDDPELIAYDRILRHYGSGCYAQTPEDNETYWRVPIGAYLQSNVVDEKTEKERVFTLNFRNVGEITIKKSTMRVSKATPLWSLGKNIFNKKSEIRRVVEEDLIKILGNRETGIRFGQLKFAFSGLQPIYRTINRLIVEDYPSYDEIVNAGKNYPGQVDLLVDIGYAEYTTDEPRKLIATNKLKELYEEKRNIEKTVDVVFGLVLAEFYYDLQRLRRIAQFIPYVRASTAYYGNAIQFGRLIGMRENTLCENIREYYKGAPTPPKLRYGYPTIIRELVDAQILEFDDNECVTGKMGIFKKLMSVREKIPYGEVPFPFGDLINGA